VRAGSVSHAQFGIPLQCYGPSEVSYGPVWGEKGGRDAGFLGCTVGKEGSYPNHVGTKGCSVRINEMFG